jgi:hypothetical protein
LNFLLLATFFSLIHISARSFFLRLYMLLLMFSTGDSWFPSFRVEYMTRPWPLLLLHKIPVVGTRFLSTHFAIVLIFFWTEEETIGRVKLVTRGVNWICFFVFKSHSICCDTSVMIEVTWIWNESIFLIENYKVP